MHDDDIYDQLADALNRLPNGFTRTPSRAEIPLLKRIYAPEYAQIASQLGREMEPLEDIAARLGLSVPEARKKLLDMARHGLVWFERQGGKARFRLAPFAIGSYEAQFDRMDPELARVFENYWRAGGAQEIMGPRPALMRVIPVQQTVKADAILPYEDVRAIVLAAKSFVLHDCICRLQQGHLGHPCTHPVRVCLTLSPVEGATGPDVITKEEALAVLDLAEESGLVHSVSNTRSGLVFVCNCCGCCCGALRGITALGIQHSVARANYYALVDGESCVGCGTCIERCQVHAITEQQGVAVVDIAHCIGCGLCITTCAQAAIRLEQRPVAEQSTPPLDFATWEQERLRNRGLSG